MLMLGNLYKEAGCLDRLNDTAQNAMMNIVTIFLSVGTGLTMQADKFQMCIRDSPDAADFVVAAMP